MEIGKVEENASKKWLNLEWYVWAIIFAVTVAILSSIIVYFIKFGFSIRQDNFDAWVKVASYWNDILQPPLLLLSVTLLFATWRTTKSELEDTRSLIKTQLKQDLMPILVAEINRKLDMLEVELNKQISHGLLSLAISRLFEKVEDYPTVTEYLQKKYDFPIGEPTKILTQEFAINITVSHVIQSTTFQFKDLYEPQEFDPKFFVEAEENTRYLYFKGLLQCELLKSIEASLKVYEFRHVVPFVYLYRSVTNRIDRIEDITLKEFMIEEFEHRLNPNLIAGLNFWVAQIKD